MRLLVTRPLPGGAATAARLQALGHEAVMAPLLAYEALRWEPPVALPDAVMLTSATAARLAGAGAGVLHAMPAYAVGEATAAAARAAGFVDVRLGTGGVQALVTAMAADGVHSALHLAGEDRTDFARPDGLNIIIRPVYRARLQGLDAVPSVDWVLLYSARTAAHFAAEIDRLGAARSAIAIVAISPAALAAAGSGWRNAEAAARPDEEALLAAIDVTWQKPAGP